MNRSRGECDGAERVGKSLEIAEGHVMKWLGYAPEESVDVGPVRLLGVTAPTVQPEFDQLVVIVGLPRDDRGSLGRLRSVPVSGCSGECNIMPILLRNFGYS